MKKTMKKIVAAASAAVMCALPMAGAFSTTANAASVEQKKTYRTYIDFSNKNNAQRSFRVLDLEFFAYNSIKMKSIKRGNIGGYISASHGSGSQYGALHHREWRTGGQPNEGTVLTILSDQSMSSSWSFDALTCIRVKAKKTDGTVLASIDVDENSGSMEHSNKCLHVETVLVGDANQDGEVDISDAVMVAQYVNSSKEVDIDLRAADADGDGYVTDTDRVTIQEYLVRLYNFSDIQ